MRLHQHTDDPEGVGTASLAGQADTARLRRPYAVDMGACDPVWTLRPRHECQVGVAVIEMAAGVTTACFTPTRREAGLQELVSQAKPSNARGGVTCRHGLLRGIVLNAVTARAGLII